MNNYLLSIDPSIKNTGFTLWKKEFCKDNNCKFRKLIVPHYDKNVNWKPILIESYSFNKKSKVNYIITNNFNYLINDFIFEMLTVKDNFLGENDINNVLNRLTLIIERGTFHSKNGIGYETQEHLRGFIAGQFNKLLTKDMLISPSEWKSWYLKELRYEEDDLFKNKKWNKEKSLYIVGGVIRQQNWNIKISNHDEADSLLIGWYYLNKENKLII